MSHSDFLQAMRQAEKGFIEFNRNGNHHGAKIEGVQFCADSTVVIVAPEVCVDYGDGHYVPMVENEPRHHRFDWLTASYRRHDHHFEIDTGQDTLSIYLSDEEPEWAKSAQVA